MRVSSLIRSELPIGIVSPSWNSVTEGSMGFSSRLYDGSTAQAVTMIRNKGSSNAEKLLLRLVVIMILLILCKGTELF